LDGAIVNAQTGGQSVAASLDGLQVLLEALTRRHRATGEKSDAIDLDLQHGQI